MRRHLSLEKPPRGPGGQPDAMKRVLFIFKTVYDAKCKGRITYGDVDQLARYVETQDALNGGVLYVCAETHVPNDQLRYARDKGVRVKRLYRNGYEEELEPE